MKNAIIIFFSYLILSFGVYAGGDNQSIVIMSEVAVQAELVGYEGFDSYPIAIIDIQAGEKQEISTDYIGLALLIFPAGQRYPVILDGKDHKINLEKESGVPHFSNSGENEFLYDFLENSMIYHTQLRILDATTNELGTEDDFAGALDQEISRVNNSIDSLHALLPDASVPMASVFIQARLLLESTYGISTIEELNDRKTLILDFIIDHYAYIGNSDMLQELGRQFMMMNEYVGRPKEQLKQDINQDVSNWILALDGEVNPADVVEFFVATYYNRSMVTQASEIVHAFYDIMLPSPSNDFFLQIGDTVPNFSVTNNDGILLEQLNTWDLLKILAIVSVDSKASLAENVVLMRMISAEKLFLPLIAISPQGFSTQLTSMSQLTTAYLFYANDDAWIDTYLASAPPLPLFMLLDKYNVILAMSNSRNEIFQEACKYMQ